MQAVNTYIIVDKIKEPKKVVKGLLLTESLDEDNRYNRRGDNRKKHNIINNIIYNNMNTKI